MLSSVRTLILCVMLAASARAAAADLDVVARVGPWPVADNLIAFRGSLWFSTAVQGRDHNSADIWRVDPEDGALTFERYLFSQGVGRPVVHDGLLYWPFEDMRAGSGDGTAAVTNGRDWRDVDLPVGDTMMHTQSMAEWRGGLVSAMAGWNSALSQSTDNGATWTVLVNDPPAVGSFHRYNDVVALGDRLFVRHWQKTGVSLEEWRDGSLEAVPDWPQGAYFFDPVLFDGALYAVVSAEGGDELWRIAASGPERMPADVGDRDWRSLVSDGENLWLVTRTDDGGRLWMSADGETFTQRESISGGVPVDAAALAPGVVYVGGAGGDGRAIVWGPTRPDLPAPAPSGFAPMPAVTDRSADGVDPEAARATITAALADPDSFANHARPLRNIIAAAAGNGVPAGFLAGLLDAPVADIDVSLFGGQFSAPARELATWHLLAAMARQGDASVPLRYLDETWTRQPNRPQKWFDPLLIAMHAVQQSGQNDRETVGALIARLDRPGDPDWLQSQVTGTLSAVTGMPFAYDHAAWKEWWASASKSWTGDSTLR